ncbi:hypothetical protein DFH11DRAFT_1627440, partial [Phellopilus nigrolimitatus]
MGEGGGRRRASQFGTCPLFFFSLVRLYCIQGVEGARPWRPKTVSCFRVFLVCFDRPPVACICLKDTPGARRATSRVASSAASRPRRRAQAHARASRGTRDRRKRATQCPCVLEEKKRTKRKRTKSTTPHRMLCARARARTRPLQREARPGRSISRTRRSGTKRAEKKRSKQGERKATHTHAFPGKPKRATASQPDSDGPRSVRTRSGKTYSNTAGVADPPSSSFARAFFISAICIIYIYIYI